MSYRTLTVCLLPVIVATTACAESETGTGGASSSSTKSATSTGTSATSATGSTTSSATGSSSISSGGGPGGVVINEISGAGDDFIELFNAGAGPVDLSGIRIADQDTPGVPKLTSALTFPEGTTLSPGSYLFILGGQATGPSTPQTTCSPGPAPCFWVSYKLSNKDGDAVFMVDKSGTILEADAYPGSIDDGQTWSRLPNGTGAFGKGASTPGAENHAP